MRKISWYKQLIYQLALACFSVFVLLPILSLVRIAFDGTITGVPMNFRIWPQEFSLAAFQQGLENPSQTLHIFGLLKNSLYVAGGAAVSSVVFGASMAYAFARLRFPGKKIGLFAILVGTLLPPVALMTPLYILLSSLGLRTLLIGLMIVYMAFSMPFCVWNMRSAFQAVPVELEEAAFLDGASPMGTFIRISFPLALPSIAVAAILAFLLGYTEFAIGWLFVESSENVTLAMAVSGMMRQSGAEWTSLSAISILMSIPVVIIFLGLHRYLVQGFLGGSIEN